MARQHGDVARPASIHGFEKALRVGIHAVGLPAIWTLIAVLIGGKLGGILGMIFCIPLTSVFYTLIGEYVQRKLKQKQPPCQEQAAEPEQ